ncbi:sterigmatocystin 8-O-methyltransferase [Colletotrichum tofieldiae]|nr:sterigmatocystin 8-O-methyltransferase [Colletotrichum tofieldiae]
MKERLIVGADQSPEPPFLGDIGGSISSDIMEFHSPGKPVLQDLPVVIGQIRQLGPPSRPCVVIS